MSFETLFITVGTESAPAAEIQFGGQRLCVVRLSQASEPQVEFVQDLYVGRSVRMEFPLSDFNATIKKAVDDVADWQNNLADGRDDA